MARRRRRVGAAAMALGLSLAAPQVAGIAAADAPDSDTGPVSAGAATPDGLNASDSEAHAPVKSQAGRTADGAGSRLRTGDPRPAAAGSDDAAPAAAVESRQSTSLSGAARADRNRPGGQQTSSGSSDATVPAPGAPPT